ncbi:DNA repair protein XRCC2-like [Amphiura filiformis]|uniref:DNA repair protein XRCC2-like n=1 Tax=Amphiura filiformis TaxID=82378 RepID=UPI003B223458
MASGFSETGAQLFARLGNKPSLIKTLDTNLFPEPLQPGNVIELYGTTCCAKTEILYHLICQCILPASWQGIELNGHSVGVVFVDTEYQFSMLRLFAILEKRILQNLDKFKMDNVDTDAEIPSGEEVENFIKTSLSKFHLVRCSSSEQLIISLHSLESLFANHPEICVLMLDSLSAFYWIDRTNAGDSGTAQETMQRKMVDVLQRLIQEYNLVLFATKPAIVQRTKKFQQDLHGTVAEASPLNSSISEQSREQIEHYEYLCNSWHKLVSHRYIIRRHDDVLANESGEKSMRALFKVTLIHPSNVKHQCTFLVTEAGVMYNL